MNRRSHFSYSGSPTRRTQLRAPNRHDESARFGGFDFVCPIVYHFCVFSDVIYTELLNLPLKALGTSSLRSGMRAQGTIEGVPKALVLAVAGQRVPLPEAADLVPGQTVTVEVAETPQGMQLRLAPVSGRSQEAPATPLPTAEALSFALEALDVRATSETVSQLLPASLPRTEAAIRSFVALFVRPQTTHEDLALIASLVAQAAEAGALPPETADEILTVLRQAASFAPTDAEGDTAPRPMPQPARPFEAAVANALPANDAATVSSALREDARAIIMRLQHDETFTGFIHEKGQLRAFQDAGARVIDRLTAAHLQNLHGLDQAYYFAEIPLPANAPVSQARIHIFGDGQRGRHEFNAKNASVAMDLSTTHLGDLWIALQMIEGRCTCHFLATSEEAAARIETGSADLKQALERAGYAGASVHVGVWDGDRLRETARLMRRFSGLDIKG